MFQCRFPIIECIFNNCLFYLSSPFFYSWAKFMIKSKHISKITYLQIFYVPGYIILLPNDPRPSKMVENPRNSAVSSQPRFSCTKHSARWPKWINDAHHSWICVLWTYTLYSWNYFQKPHGCMLENLTKSVSWRTSNELIYAPCHTFI